jgi:hypothetical protein
MMKRDPAMQGYGRGRNRFYICAAEGCEQRLNEVAVKNQDPFCSGPCARAYHGVEITLPGRGVYVGSSS